MKTRQNFGANQENLKRLFGRAKLNKNDETQDFASGKDAGPNIIFSDQKFEELMTPYEETFNS